MIKRLFIKNYMDIENPIVRNRYGVVSGAFGIISNTVLFCIKLIIGIIANSITIIADAFNNLSDSLTSIITIIGFKLSSRPADKEHPYGHARYEYITGIIVAFFVFAVGILFVKSSIEKIIYPEEIILSVATYITLIISIIIKFLQMMLYLNFAKAINSKVIKANAEDSKNDIIMTSAVLFAMIIMGIFNINVDGYIGLIISIFIVISSIKMIKETIDPLLGVIPSQEQIDKIKKEILKYDGVEGIHDLLIHNYGEKKDFVTVHVEVSSDMNIVVAHDLADSIERHFRDDLNLNLTVHIDPIDIKNKEINILRNKIKKVLNEFDSEISFHDFRVVETTEDKKVFFDVVVPFDKQYNEEQIIDILKGGLEDENAKIVFLLNVEKPVI